MQLRPYRPSDLSRLYDIDQACFPPGISYTRQELMRFIRQPKSWTWVAEEEGDILGFAIASEEPQKGGHVITLDVEQARRRSGVGTALMDAAEAWARRKGLQLMYLETGEENHAAQHFYLRRGYVKVDELTDYYARGKSAWLMIKWFS